MRRICTRVLVAMMGTAAAYAMDASGHPGVGQLPEYPGAPASLSDQLRCVGRPCKIVLTRVVTLASTLQPEQLPQAAVQVVQDSHERFLVRARSFDDILVFDSNGRLISTANGSGTRRFRAIGGLALGPDDAIWVHDYRASRVFVLDAALKTTERLVSPFGPSIVRKDGTWIVNTQIQSAALIGYPIHVTDRAGSVVRSFGAEIPQYRSDIRLLATRLVSPAADGTIWAVAPGRYVVERWEPDTGRLRERVAVRSAWFRESAQFRTDERERPDPVIESIWEQGELVWLLIRVADRHWIPPVRANKERPHDPVEYEQTYDWMLEAVDPSDGTVVASERFSWALWARPGPLLATLAVPDGAEPRTGIDVWRASIR